MVGRALPPIDHIIAAPPSVNQSIPEVDCLLFRDLHPYLQSREAFQDALYFLTQYSSV